MLTIRTSMPDYLQGCRAALGSLLQLVQQERRELGIAEERLARLTAEVVSEYDTGQDLDLGEEDPDEVMRAATRHTEGYWLAGGHTDEVRRHLVHAQVDVTAHREAAAAAAGAVLQIAEQGLLLVHGSREHALGHGRHVCTGQALSTVVLAAREQAAQRPGDHPSPGIAPCFAALAEQVDASFAEHRHRRMSTAVLQLLEWETPDDVARDLLAAG
ncbi:hypothetical protein CLV92_11442 [Kineococcus xinjiangensis]|uniref:Uncharacterized protein n=1 Tax=Kineococcus xinjiangensis TaxID=512762 RepID=A0A2S6IE08_9ACTN|nr:hypothetical protein [Kineococcus xinjiangensis]PPK92441.1 hypothetical protein CLV92_11442 [Kineococcus xinjiangensis]